MAARSAIEARAARFCSSVMLVRSSPSPGVLDPHLVGDAGP
jgi:hypothetical protein